MASPEAAREQPEAESIEERLRKQTGERIEPTIPLDPEPACEKGAPSPLFQRLRTAGPRGSRYRLLGEVARGGMGVILKIWDDELRRTLAMKVVLGKGGDGGADTPVVDPRTLGRFLEEAQVTGQLDHPGIVPVHELGLGADGHVYFTMRLVRGEDLRSVFEKVRTGAEGWNQVRALGVLLKVCEAMAYAHSKKVIHRDLKPANVMVGKFGEVYVMDWGLARVAGRVDKHDLRIQPAGTQSAVKTERREHREDTPDSPLITMEGDVVGTPCFMPPEQARGDLDQLGPHSDVYSLGAMLYQLLTGEMPYMPKGARISPRTVLLAVVSGPPAPVRSLAPKTPAELVSICNKAMARDVTARYADMQALATDLRAYLEDRVVSAHDTGRIARSLKWIQRNRPRGAALRILVVLLITLAANRTHASIKDRRRVEQITFLRDAAVVREREARVRGLIQDVAQFRALDDAPRLAGLPPGSVHAWWLERARALVDGVAEDAERKVDWAPGLRDAERLLERVRSGLASHDATAARSTLEASADAWWHDQLAALVDDLRRLKAREELVERCVEAPEARRAWSDAIALVEASPAYGRLNLAPQVDLLPLGPDPTSGWMEFAHLPTGAPPVRGSDGKLAIGPETGLVFVLVPAGRVPVEEGNGSAQASELCKAELAPFLMAKHEMTRGQWERARESAGLRGRSGAARSSAGELAAGTSMLPVTGISWLECVELLDAMDGWLRLPTEAQWERACRAGSSTMWSTGNDEQELRAAARFGMPEAGPDRVGARLPNAYGFHDMHGNAWEWCLDAASADDLARRSGDGLAIVEPEDGAPRALRGGSFARDASNARSWFSWPCEPSRHDGDFGVRPVRVLLP